jgi:hypothetical protein
VTAVAADQREDRRLVTLEIADRSGLVLAHETAVASDVRGQDGGEPAAQRLAGGHRVSGRVENTTGARRQPSGPWKTPFTPQA